MGKVDEAISWLKENKGKSVNAFLFGMASNYPRRRRLTEKVYTLSGEELMIANIRELLLAVMSEGDDEVAELLRRLQWVARSYAPNRNLPWDNLSCIFGLDDMNIRGSQILYAYEYCDGDITLFMDKIFFRDSEMLDYINCSSVNEAKRTGAPYTYKAVSGQAGFEGFKDGMIFSGDYNLYDTPLGKASVVYAAREIYNGTSMKEALGTLKANGFEEVYNQKIKTVGTDIHGERYCVIMVNPDTGAILNAGGAQESDFCYGGCEIIVCFKSKVGPWGNGGPFSIFKAAEVNRVNGVEDHYVAKISYQNSMITCYREVVDTYEMVKDTSILGYGYDGIPLPKRIDYSGVFYAHRDYKNPIFYSFSGKLDFHFALLIGSLFLEKALKYVPDDKKWLYKPFIEDKYSRVFDCIFFTTNLELYSLLFGAVSRMYNIPDSELSKYFDVAFSLLEDPRWQGYASRLDRDLFFGRKKLTDQFLEEFGLEDRKPKVDKRDNKLPIGKVQLLNKTLYGLVYLLGSYGGKGDWSLFEDSEIIYLKGSTGTFSKPAYEGAKVQVVEGDFSAKGLSKLSDCIDKTIDSLNRKIPVKIKKITFPLSTFKEGYIYKSDEEKGSIELLLK